MKWFFAIALFIFGSCSSHKDDKSLQQEIDSLQSALHNTYRPGFGEFMSSIQAHHNKLWFAGKYENWKLADFEIHEILESIEDIEKFQQDRPETKALGMIKAPIDSVLASINQKDPRRFNSSYLLLTNTCNSCHQATNFEFNRIKVPGSSPFTNQEFAK
jgi:hypothetical protein